MPPAGGDHGAGEDGGRPMPRGVGRSAAAGAGQDLGAEPGSRKRKGAVMSEDLISLDGNGDHLKVACGDSQMILDEIEYLRAQLDKDLKELGYCEANQKLRVELALKVKEMQSLMNHNEEIHRKTDGMRMQNEELQTKNDDLVKEREELQTNIDSMRKQHGELQAKNGDLQAKNDRLMKQNEELQTLNDGLTKHNEELEAKNVSLVKQNEEVQAKNGILTKLIEELESKDDGLMKQNEVVQAKNDGLIKQNGDLQAKNVGLVKQNTKLQDTNDGLTKRIEDLEAKNNSQRKRSEDLQARIDSMTKQNMELQAKNDGLRKRNNKLQDTNDGFTKRIEELEANNDSQRKRSEELQARNDNLIKQNEDMQAKNGSLMKRVEELQAKNDILIKQNEGLHAKNDGLAKRNEELQANNDCMRKWNTELHAKNDGFHKNIMEILENEIDTKRKHWLQIRELYSTIDSPSPHLEEGNRMLHESFMEESSSKLVYTALAEKSGVNRKTEDKSEQLEVEVAKLDTEDPGKTENLSELLEIENFSEELGSVKMLKSSQMNMELQDTERDLIVGLKDGFTGCTDTGTEISWDIILESVQRLKKAEPTLWQAASSFEEIRRLQAQVTRLNADLNQLRADNCALVETKAALREEVAACAADLEHTRKKNEELESEKALAEQLMALVQQVLNPLKEFDVKIPDLERMTLKARTRSLEQIAAELKKLPEIIRHDKLELVKASVNLFGSHLLAILKSHLPDLDLSVLKQGFKGSEKEAAELDESLRSLVEPMSHKIEYDGENICMYLEF